MPISAGAGLVDDRQQACRTVVPVATDGITGGPWVLLAEAGDDVAVLTHGLGELPPTHHVDRVEPGIALELGPERLVGRH